MITVVNSRSTPLPPKHSLSPSPPTSPLSPPPSIAIPVLSQVHLYIMVKLIIRELRGFLSHPSLLPWTREDACHGGVQPRDFPQHQVGYVVVDDLQTEGDFISLRTSGGYEHAKVHLRVEPNLRFVRRYTTRMPNLLVT